MDVRRVKSPELSDTKTTISIKEKLFLPMISWRNQHTPEKFHKKWILFPFLVTERAELQTLLDKMTYWLALSLFVDGSQDEWESSPRFIERIGIHVFNTYIVLGDDVSSLWLVLHQSPGDWSNPSHKEIERFTLKIGTRVFKNLIFMRRYIKFVIQLDYSISW